MRWYRALFWGYFCWFEKYEERDLRAAGNACIVMAVLHVLQIVAAAELWRHLSDSPVPLYDLAGRYWPGLVLLVFAHSGYFLYGFSRIKKEFAPSERRAPQTLATVHLVGTAVAFVTAFAI